LSNAGILVAALFFLANIRVVNALDQFATLSATLSASHDSIRFDLGNLVVSEKRLFSLELLNKTGVDFEVEGASSSCGCVVATIEEKRFASGGILRVRVSVTSGEGSVRRLVSIQLKSDGEPKIVSLELVARGLPRFRATSNVRFEGGVEIAELRLVSPVKDSLKNCRCKLESSEKVELVDCRYSENEMILSLKPKDRADPFWSGLASASETILLNFEDGTHFFVPFLVETSATTIMFPRLIDLASTKVQLTICNRTSRPFRRSLRLTQTNDRSVIVCTGELESSSNSLAKYKLISARSLPGERIECVVEDRDSDAMPWEKIGIVFVYVSSAQ
jgi:Protein of unknown function (DUF1573)